MNFNPSNDNSPYVVFNPTTKEVYGRFFDLEKAHEGRLMTQLNDQEARIMLFNQVTGKFVEWRKKEKLLYNKYKDDTETFFLNKAKRMGMIKK